MAGTKSDQLRPVDDRVALGGISLRVLRWQAQPVFDRAEEALPPFLLVHGLASNARLWDGMARRLAQAGRSSVAVDLRGHGHSDKPDTGYDFATISSDLEALIRTLGLDRPIVAGQSWGASVVLDLAVGKPDLVRGIVLVDGGLTNMKDAFPTWDICWQRLAPPSLVGLPLEAVEGYFRTNHADWPEEGIEGSLGNFEIRPDNTIAPWLTRDRHKAILEAMWSQRTSDLWRDLRVPALIVPVDGGENDWTSAKRAGVESALAAARARGTPVRVEWFRGDHDIHAQRPAELGSAILEAERAGLFGAGSSPVRRSSKERIGG
jgi:pimeloyl-ACP methyl ester carboxylesterase